MKARSPLLPLALAGLLASASSVAEPVDDQYTYNNVLFLTGYQVERAPQAGELMQRRQEMCNVWPLASQQLKIAMMTAKSAKELGMAELDPGLAALIQRIEFGLNMAGIDIWGDFARHLDTVEEALCKNDEEGYFGHFAISYAHCRMTMETGSHTMDIHLPPGSGAALMQAVDLVKGEGFEIDLARDLDRTMTVTGAGWASGVSMTPDGQTQEWLGYETHHYNYEYSAGMGGDYAAPGMDWIASKISVDNKGSAWVAPEVRGDSIPRRFYWNLATQVEPAQGMSGFFGGMILNNVGMLQHGLPLFVESKVTSRISGKSVISADSQAIITGVNIRPMPAGYCDQAIVPPDVEMTNVSEQLGEMMAQSSAQTAASQNEMAAAMASMTPEQLAMMESMGLTDMMGAGGAGAALQQGGSATPPPAATAPRGSSLSLASALAGDTDVETVQNYLQALGYDTGDANGEVNLETTIAISQFQAENNMEATGEISPVLIGVLAAKVDAL